MLKRQIIKKLTITSAILFSFFLVCIMPNKNEKVTFKEEVKYMDDLKRENIYLLDKNNYLGRTRIVINSTDIVSKAKELLNSLMIENDNEYKIPNGFKGIINSETKILNIEYKDNIIKVDFSKELLDTKKEYEEKIIESIIYTLTSIEEIKKVMIFVEGKILSYLPQTKISLPSILDRNFGINKEYNLKKYKDTKKVTIYYLKDKNNEIYYVPVTKYINSDKEKIDIIINELKNSSNELKSYLNNNTVILESKKNNDTLELVFNEKIYDNSDSIRKEVIETISLSMKDNFDVDKVSFRLNNKEIFKSVIKTIE